MSKQSHSARSMAYLREQGFAAVGKTEYWGAFSHKRHDLFGFIDLIALSMDMIDRTDGQIVAVQVTDERGGKLHEHIAKIRSIPEARYWVSCGGAITIHNWRKRNRDGCRDRRKVWVCQEIEMDAAIFNAAWQWDGERWIDAGEPQAETEVQKSDH